jgi:asparagine synthase (glutamine-hydrolysing)
MCGLIAALLTRPTLTEERIAAALAAMRHRGPDNTSCWFSSDRRVALGHVRLSIIGLLNGDQPIVNANGDVRCVVNGEFYGYKAIRAHLAAEGARLSTDTDSEIAIHLYEKYGAEFVHHLRGEFALVIADERRRCLIAARDRFGIKPLFYTVLNGAVLLASEIKALLALGAPARWDEDGFLANCYHTRPASQTVFAGIRAVPPGCLLFAKDGVVDIRPYWDTLYPAKQSLAADTRSDEDVIAGFRAVLDEAVAERLVADVEVACYLSGGIDSCAVLGLAQRHMNRPIRAFTIAFSEEMYNEESAARDMAKLAGADFIPVPVSQQQIADSFADAVWYSECPMINGNGAAKYLLSRAVRDAGVKVVFTGEGSDEILAGYPTARRDLVLFNSDGLDANEVQHLLGELEAANPVSRGMLTPHGDTTPGLDIIQSRLGFVPSWLHTTSNMAAKLVPVFRNPVREYLARGNPYAELLDTIDTHARLSGRDPVNQSLYLWNHTVLVNTILTYLGDRMEMAHSVEGRVPFLDHHVTEYVAGLPIRHKIRGRREKYVLREALRDIITPEVYNKHKHPFVAPPPRRENDPLYTFCQDVLHSKLLYDQPFFDPTRVHRMMDHIATLDMAERIPYGSTVMMIVSTCILQQRFGLSGGEKNVH